MYMAIYNKYDGNITYIPISSVEQRDLSNKPVEDRFLKYIITNQKNATLNDFRFMHGEKIFEPIDAYIPVNTNRKTDNEIKKLEDFFSFAYALICRRHKGLYNRDIGTIDEIERYIWDNFGIAP